MTYKETVLCNFALYLFCVTFFLNSIHHSSKERKESRRLCLNLIQIRNMKEEWRGSTQVCIWIRACAYVYICIYAQICVYYICMWIRVYEYVYICTYVKMYTCTYVYGYVYMNTRIYCLCLC